jgi:serine/threonine-protein kinase
VKLTDFGIAKAADAVPVTRSGMVMGTAHYIAPEQASGSEAGPAGDVYSLGIVGYECLAGHRPFRAESAVAVAMMQVRDEPPPLPTTVPSAARALIEAVLVKDPTQRYATGGEFALAVGAVRRGEPIPPPASISGETPVIPARPPATPARPRPAVTVSAPLSAPVPYAPSPDAHPAAAAPTEVRSSRPARQRTSVRQARRATPERTALPLPTEPLRLQPNASGRTLLLVLFVLLTLAAVAVGVVVYGGLSADGTPEQAPQSAGTGTVSGWEGILAGSAVSGGPLGPVSVTGSVR